MPFLLPPLLVVHLQEVVAVLSAVSPALLFSLSPLAVELPLLLPVPLPADITPAASQVPIRKVKFLHHCMLLFSKNGH